MNKSYKIISPVDNSVYAERKYHSIQEIDKALTRAEEAQQSWRTVSLEERETYIKRFLTSFVELSDQISEELAWQMGRPISYGPKEVSGTIERATGMLDLARTSLEDILVENQGEFHKYIKREPLGVIFVIAAWNYPFLIAVNSIIPGLLAGNAVILKHSAQTPLVAERFADAFQAAGLPEGLFQYLHLTHADSEKVIRDSRINYVAFTGSVEGGYQVQKTAASQFINVGLELGGKDPAYVHKDADLQMTTENLVDGAFFNSGQSCCSIERIYVHEDVYDKFVEGFVNLVMQYKLGNPFDTKTTLGPVAKRSVADTIFAQIEDAVKNGAKKLIDPKNFPETQLGYEYLAPQVLVDVNHDMMVMTEESFGPVVGIMKVKDENEAITLMNDSPYGLTASVWTQDEALAALVLNQIETGTCFMNRCDYLDPYLAWTGVKDTGRGCTLSSIGYEQLTKPKSFHLKRNK